MGPVPSPANFSFTRITESLIRKRAEHNEGMVSTLEEVALHQQNIGRIELLGQLCPRLKILYLQNNLIGKLENLHKLKEMEYLNMAVNNVTRIQNLQRCESLQKLDLTINFVDKAGLLTISSLQGLPNLTELTLMGNPCAEWSGYRPYVIARLPQLKKLDSTSIKHSDRISASQLLPELEARLRMELIKEGVDPDTAAQVEDDSLIKVDENGEILETGRVDEETGEVRRPWCPATRILDHVENEKANREAEARKKPGTGPGADLDAAPKNTRHEDFPEIKDGERVMQRNEGRWEFSMEENDDRTAIVFEVEVGKYLDTSLIKADVQPEYIRLLIKGRLLQLLLPCEVRPDTSSAVRSQASGKLQITLPKEDPSAAPNIAHIRPKQSYANGKSQSSDLLTAKATTRTVKKNAHSDEGDMCASGTNQPCSTSNAQAIQGLHISEKAQEAALLSALGVGLGVGSRGGTLMMKPVRKAAVVACEAGDDDDAIPDLI